MTYHILFLAVHLRIVSSDVKPFFARGAEVAVVLSSSGELRPTYVEKSLKSKYAFDPLMCKKQLQNTEIVN